MDFENPAVGAVVTNQQGQFLFIKTQRYVQQQQMWEIPAGSAETDEELVLAAAREVYEETGYTVKLKDKPYYYYPSNGISNQEFHLFFGKLDETIPQSSYDLDEVEIVAWFSKEQVLSMIQENQIQDGMSLTALLLYFQSK